MAPNPARRPPQTIPIASLAAPARRLIVCLDGTANGSFSERRKANGMKVVKPSNVLKLARAVLPWDADGRREQIVYYDTGVGSLALYPGLANRILRLNDKIWGGLGAGFEANVEDAAHFLSLNHRPGDEVFVFGFSRGAATAQALTRFLDWSHGLPAKGDAYFLPHLFREFLRHRAQKTVEEAVQEINDKTRQRKTQRPDLAPFRPVSVRFLGLWDTVMALGSRFKAVGDTTSDPENGFYRTREPAACVRHTRHALAVDERRFDFRPEVFQGFREGQTLVQRWFPGVHSNVGGSYVEDGLANIAFQWIWREAVGHGLQVDETFTGFYRPYPLAKMYDSHHWLYKVAEGVRFRLGRGRRSIVGHAETASLSLDRSVIERMLWTPGQDPRARLKSAYRPRNVLLFLSCQPDLDAYLRQVGLAPDQIAQVPEDLRRQVARLRHDCRQHVGPTRAPSAGRTGAPAPKLTMRN